MQHDLTQRFPLLARFRSTRELQTSSLYARLRPEVERILTSVAREIAEAPGLSYAFAPCYWSLGLKLDWFAARGVEPVASSDRVLAEANRSSGRRPSDHDPIVVDVVRQGDP